jgi:N-acetylglucosaminyl-diphospho-decaprenol L-rhamnosyltransferase
MDLAIVTVSYNTRELLADCLTSVGSSLERSGLQAGIWVVDNASADGSPDMVSERFPSAHLIRHNRNAGFAAGNNLALRSMGFGVETKPRHVLFLNPDTRVVGNSLEVMVEFLDSTPQAGVAGARLVYDGGGFQHSAFSFPGLLQIFFDFFPTHHRLLDSRLNGRYPRHLYEGGQPFPVDHPLGAALMVRSEALAEVQGFDERFFMYCEEIDLCRRIMGSDWGIYCVPEAEIVHLSGQSTRQFRDRMFVALWRSRFLMFYKHEGAAFRLAARWLVRGGLWAETQRAGSAHRRSEITDGELQSRLAAYQEVAEL